MVCLDAGGTLGPVNIVADLVSYQYNPYSQSLVSTNVAECMRQHLNECVEFIADLHTINKVKVSSHCSNCKGARFGPTVLVLQQVSLESEKNGILHGFGLGSCVVFFISSVTKYWS